MRIISFAHTTPALVAGHKSVIRRAWKERYARFFHSGDHLQAWDKSPRFGGKKVAEIRLTRDPYQELTTRMPLADYDREGFRFMQREGIEIDGMEASRFWLRWVNEPVTLWVIRFELTNLAGSA